MVARDRALSASFAARWRELGAPKRLLLAVSGGSDSIALMHLAASLPAVELRVATVDHGLRPTSADDARFVENEAAAVGVEAVTLRWEGEKPTTGIQAAARAARYRLLARDAECWRAAAILVAHTADDQAETVFMRMAHRSGARGLSGMSDEILIADGARAPQRLLRPLLSQRRAALRDYLGDIRAAFIEDPGNHDLGYERVRVRRRLAASPACEEATRALLGLAGDARRLTAMLDRLDATRLDALGVRFRADGSVSVDADAVAAIDGALAARLIGAAGGGDSPDADAAASAIGAALRGRPATLAGALVARGGARLLIGREPSAVLGRTGGAAIAPVSLAPGARFLWDRRFIVENTFGDSAQIRPIGAAAKSLTSEEISSLATAPGLWIGDSLAAFPGDDGPGEVAISSLVAERFHRLVVRH